MSDHAANVFARRRFTMQGEASHRKGRKTQQLRRERQAERRKARRSKPGTQLDLGLRVRTWGGARKRAGRPRRSERPRVAHVSRAPFKPRHPIHVTWRM